MVNQTDHIVFQFHKVRLKGRFSLLLCSKDTKFQFHKVRLKVFLNILALLSSMFQFHKVRLKDR